jgi:hypothetical protein
MRCEKIYDQLSDCHLIQGLLYRASYKLQLKKNMYSRGINTGVLIVLVDNSVCKTPNFVNDHK